MCFYMNLNCPRILPWKLPSKFRPTVTRVSVLYFLAVLLWQVFNSIVVWGVVILHQYNAVTLNFLTVCYFITLPMALSSYQLTGHPHSDLTVIDMSVVGESLSCFLLLWCTPEVAVSHSQNFTKFPCDIEGLKLCKKEEPIYDLKSCLAFAEYLSDSYLSSTEIYFSI